MKSSSSTMMAWAFCHKHPQRDRTRKGSLFVSPCTGDIAIRLKPAQEGPPMLRSHPSATQHESVTQEESKTRKKSGNVFIPVFPCPFDLQVSAGNSLVHPALGTDPAGTDFGTAARGSRQAEGQPQQFYKREETHCSMSLTRRVRVSYYKI